MGAWNLDPNGWILAADETVISTVDLYANGYVEKEGWGSTFGTSFATPTAAAAFTNYLNDWIDELNESGENLSDVELTEEELEAIDYSDMVNSIISLITESVNVTVSNVGQLLEETVDVLDYTISKDGLDPTPVDSISPYTII